MLLFTLNKNLAGNELKEELRSAINEINLDFTGENGIEYISEEAFEGGFKSDLDYYFDLYNKYYDGADLIKYIFAEVVRGSYIYQYEMLEEKDMYIFAIYIQWD